MILVYDRALCNKYHCYAAHVLETQVTYWSTPEVLGGYKFGSELCFCLLLSLQKLLSAVKECSSDARESVFYVLSIVQVPFSFTNY